MIFYYSKFELKPVSAAANFLNILVKKLAAAQQIQGELLDFLLNMPGNLVDGYGWVWGATRGPPLGSFRHSEPLSPQFDPTWDRMDELFHALKQKQVTGLIEPIFKNEL
jgi:hypothetical protein